MPCRQLHLVDANKALKSVATVELCLHGLGNQLATGMALRTAGAIELYFGIHFRCYGLGAFGLETVLDQHLHLWCRSYTLLFCRALQCGIHLITQG